MMTLAKALYDNTAECPDELAFRKGDILTVMEQNVADTSGWWMCSLYGRQGLAPANRLRLLSQATGGPTATLCPKQDIPPLEQSPSNSPQNIYQIPNVTRSNSAVCERTDLLQSPVSPCVRDQAVSISASFQGTDFQHGLQSYRGALRCPKPRKASVPLPCINYSEGIIPKTFPCSKFRTTETI